MEQKKDLLAEISEAPREQYVMQFTQEEVTLAEQAQLGKMKKNMLKTFLWGVVCTVLFALADRFGLGLGLGLMIATLLTHWKSLLSYKKMYEETRGRVVNSLYDYRVYDQFVLLWASAEDSVRQVKVAKEEIYLLQDAGNMRAFVADRSVYFIKKDALAEESFFLTLGMK